MAKKLNKFKKKSINSKIQIFRDIRIFHHQFGSPGEAGAALAARVTGEATGQAPAHQCNATNFEPKTRSLGRAGVAVMAGAHTGVWPHQLAVTYRGWVLRVARVAAF